SGLSLKPQTPQQASPITAMQLLPGGSQAILGRYGQLVLVDLATQAELRTWDGVVGKVTSLRRTTDPDKLVVASGVSGLGGQVSILNLATMALEGQWEGHSDILYAAVMSPDQRWLATAGYDRTILIWDLA
ncbi:MAG: WD40 repeat domain-containing protein, partial [Pirellulaceae bacterium]